MVKKEWVYIKYYGIRSAMILIGINLLIGLIGFKQFPFQVFETIVYASMLFALGFLTLAIKSCRDHLYNGIIRFKKAFSIGMKTALFPTFAYMVYVLLFYTFEGDSFIQYNLEQKKLLLNDSDYADYAAHVLKNKELYTSPFVQAGVTTGTILFMSMIISVFSSLVLTTTRKS